MAKPNNWQELSSFQTLVREINDKWGSTYVNPKTDINIEIRKAFDDLEDDYVAGENKGSTEEDISAMFDELEEIIGCPKVKKG